MQLNQMKHNREGHIITPNVYVSLTTFDEMMSNLKDSEFMKKWYNTHKNDAEILEDKKKLDPGYSWRDVRTLTDALYVYKTLNNK
jgi:hypothetical protein